MRNFSQFLPEDKRNEVQLEADYDSVHAVVQGFNVGVKVVERVPYSRIDFADDGAPFNFAVSMHFDAVPGDPEKTDFSVEVHAELNMMMKMMLSSRIQEALDKMVDGMAANG